MRLVLIAALLLAACASPAPAPAPPPGGTHQPSAPPSGGPACGIVPPVYHPQRLKVLGYCERFRGTVIANLHERDGDHHLWIVPDTGYERFLNAKNVFHGQRALVAEIVPACSSEPLDEAQAAACPPSQLPEPGVRQHVEITGQWVLDTVHGWLEIHPVASLQEVSALLVIPDPDPADENADD